MNEAESKVLSWILSSPPGGGSDHELPDLASLVGRPAWHADAACKGQSELFFVRGTPLKSTRDICRGCSVRVPCLQFALGDPDLVGIWGGTTERERRAMRAGRVA